MEIACLREPANVCGCGGCEGPLPKEQEGRGRGGSMKGRNTRKSHKSSRLTRGTQRGGIDCRTINVVWTGDVHDSQARPKPAATTTLSEDDVSQACWIGEIWGREECRWAGLSVHLVGFLGVGTVGCVPGQTQRMDGTRAGCKTGPANGVVDGQGGRISDTEL